MKTLWLLLSVLLVIGCAGRTAPQKNAAPHLVEEPGDVCFSPVEICDEKLIEFIRAAKASLDVAIYDITHPQIVHELLFASRKVSVRILVDRMQSKGSHSLVSTLIRGGISVRNGYQKGIMHHKFIIRDSEAVETGSFNFTNSASFRNQENQVYLYDSVIVRRYQNQFEKMWRQGRDPRIKKDY